MSLFNNHDLSQTRQRYSIKKFKFGVASVLVGLSFLGSASPVMAETSVPSTVIEENEDGKKITDEVSLTEASEAKLPANTTTDTSVVKYEELESVRQSATTVEEIQNIIDLARGAGDENNEKQSSSSTDSVPADREVEPKEMSDDTRDDKEFEEEAEVPVTNVTDQTVPQINAFITDIINRPDNTPLLERFDTTYQTSEDKVDAVKVLLSQVYTPEVVNELTSLAKLNLSKGMSSKEVLTAILAAGVELANNKSRLDGGHHVLAVLEQPVALGRATYNPKARLIVTSQNASKHFTSSGHAYRKPSGVFVLTEDTSGQAGSVPLKRRIDMNQSFVLEGRVNLGNKYEGKKIGNRAGGDGISFSFTTAVPGAVGIPGASIGLGTIPYSFGFKLDTWHNTSRPNSNQKSEADPKFPGYQNGAFGAFFATNNQGVAYTAKTDAARLIKQPESNNFEDVVVEFNGRTKEMTVTYAGQTFRKNVQGYIDSTRNTTRQIRGSEELSFAIFGSTGAGTNLQEFELKKFEYSTGGSYITVRQVDDSTGKLLNEKTFSSEDYRNSVIDLRNELNLPNYILSRSNEDTARGYKSKNRISFIPGLQTVTYTYKQDANNNGTPDTDDVAAAEAA
ncbi:lectin-like domain-containing protein, partial [Streptococcus pluranimalium]|uniref:lectin-like domain-containing protein n=1 Tax=Streptococcus pluranimalium TaxID=82348 RepID=UPI0039FB8FC4